MPFALDHLPTELLFAIVSYLDEPTDFASSYPHPNSTPALKNLSVCSRRLHAVTSPILFQSIRLLLNDKNAPSEITRLNSFLSTTGYLGHVSRIAIVFGDQWNADVSCLVLKKFLHDLHIRSLCLRQVRPDATIREKSARWFGNLNELRKLRLETIDDVSLPTMLLVQKAPIEVLEVDDGKHVARTDWTFSRRNELEMPGIGALKPQLFTQLRKVVYSSFAPASYRVRVFVLQFVRKLPAVRVLDVEFAQCGFPFLKSAKGNFSWWIRTTEEGGSYVEMITTYEILAREVEKMVTLEKIVCRDWKWFLKDERGVLGPFHPSGFIGLAPGTLVRAQTGSTVSM